MWLALWLRECTVAGRFGCGPSAPTSGAVPTAGAVVSRDIRRLRQAQRLRRGYSSTDAARVHNLAPVIAHVTGVGLSAGKNKVGPSSWHTLTTVHAVSVCLLLNILQTGKRLMQSLGRTRGWLVFRLVAVPRLCVAAGD